MMDNKKMVLIAISIVVIGGSGIFVVKQTVKDVTSSQSPIQTLEVTQLTSEEEIDFQKRLQELIVKSDKSGCVTLIGSQYELACQDFFEHRQIK